MEKSHKNFGVEDEPRQRTKNLKFLVGQESQKKPAGKLFLAEQTLRMERHVR